MPKIIPLHPYRVKFKTMKPGDTFWSGQLLYQKMNKPDFVNLALNQGVAICFQNGNIVTFLDSHEIRPTDVEIREVEDDVWKGEAGTDLRNLSIKNWIVVQLLPSL